jgi:hypothetical protein
MPRSRRPPVAEQKAGHAAEPLRAARGAVVHELARLRIERALAQRTRYRYVKPSVLPEGTGWKVVSPNCSRSVDPTGGDIDVAWLEPVHQRESDGRIVSGWLLHSRDHARQVWRVHSAGALPDLLDALCLDRQREFWQ